MGRLIYLVILFFLCLPVRSGSGAAEPLSDKQEMVLIPEGEFTMGSPETARYPAEEQPAHRVFTPAFYMQIHEVTNTAFASFLNAVLRKQATDKERERWIVIRDDLKTEKGKDFWPADITFEDGIFRPVAGFEQYPVISVSWYGAEAYCKWAGGRLPTEAEWEKAGRGGLQGSDYPWGNMLPNDGIIFNRTWVHNHYPAPVETVRSYYPNGYGLYGMAGNAAEWCSDWYEPSYYRHSPHKSPKGPDTGNSKVTRGGSWASNAHGVRVGFRNFGNPAGMPSGVGFRCVKDAGK
jgi:formylglycine-generating enzyme required for sulfatase activity